MTFNELNRIMEEKFGSMRLADIAREFDVTPQVVSNWKSRDQVPYKYVKILRKKITGQKNQRFATDTESDIITYNLGNREVSDQIDFLEIIRFLWSSIIKNKILFVLIPALITFYQVINLLFYVDPEYTSTARILPGSSNNKDRISGFAAQFGISVGPNPSDFSAAELYPDVIKSKELLKVLLSRRFNTIRFGNNKTLLQIITGHDDKSDNIKKDLLVYKGVRILKNKMIRISTSRISPLIDVSVNTFEPKLARDLVKAIIEELDTLQNNFKISRIKEKRIFIENRVAELDIDLNEAEEILKKFREANRNINSSPALLLEESRYERELMVLTQLYITLKNEYEQMQIEEVEESRMFVVLDEPEAPFKKTGPNRTKIVISYLLFGIIVSAGLVTLKNWMQLNWQKIIKPLFFT